MADVIDAKSWFKNDSRINSFQLLYNKIEKIKPQPGDLLVFQWKTDDYGIPIGGYETMNRMVDQIVTFIHTEFGEDIKCLFLTDKVGMTKHFCAEEYDKEIAALEETIEYLKREKDRFQERRKQNAVPKTPWELFFDKIQQDMEDGGDVDVSPNGAITLDVLRKGF